MRLRASLFILLFSTNVSYAGLFSDSSAREQIETLNKQMQEMEARILSIEENLRNQAVLELYSQLETFKIELGKLHGQIELLTEENKLLKKQQKDFYIDLDSRLRQVEPTNDNSQLGLEASQYSASPAPTAAITVNPTVEPTGGSERDAYNAAYDLFKEGNYSGAIAQFENFLQRYPASNLAPGAAYWIGNAYYALREFGAAINAQQKVIENYPHSSKAPDAMLNMASSQMEMAEASAAKNTLQNLITKYPSSEAAVKAKQRLASMK